MKDDLLRQDCGDDFPEKHMEEPLKDWVERKELADKYEGCFCGYEKRFNVNLFQVAHILDKFGYDYTDEGLTMLDHIKELSVELEEFKVIIKD